MSAAVWFRRGTIDRQAIGVRIMRTAERLFTDRYVWRGFTLFGWRVSFVGWRR